MQNLTPQVAKTTLATINTITRYEKPNAPQTYTSTRSPKKMYPTTSLFSHSSRLKYYMLVQTRPRSC